MLTQQRAGLVESLYEPLVEDARRRFASNETLARVISTDVHAADLEYFLIQFSSFGVGMTEPVEGWVRRAGERCEEIGLPELGRMFRAHALQEAGHHELMIADTRHLVARWNSRGAPQLDADALLHRSLPAGARRYRALHEEVLSGAAPYGQLSIEFEIEALSVRFGPLLIGNCRRVLGDDILKDLSFLEEHVTVDVGHTALNHREMEKLLSSGAASTDLLATAGSAALDAYACFLDDCGDHMNRAGGIERSQQHS